MLNIESDKPIVAKYKTTRKPKAEKVNGVDDLQKHKQPEEQKNEINQTSVSLLATEELLTNLASKLVAASSQTQSYQDVSIINSAYHKVSAIVHMIYWSIVSSLYSACIASVCSCSACTGSAVLVHD